MDWLRQLGLIEAHVRAARESLADEHEGNFKYHVREAQELSAELRRAVDYM